MSPNQDKVALTSLPQAGLRLSTTKNLEAVPAGATSPPPGGTQYMPIQLQDVTIAMGKSFTISRLDWTVTIDKPRPHRSQATTTKSSPDSDGNLKQWTTNLKDIIFIHDATLTLQPYYTFFGVKKKLDAIRLQGAVVYRWIHDKPESEKPGRHDFRVPGHDNIVIGLHVEPLSSPEDSAPMPCHSSGRPLPVEHEDVLLKMLRAKTNSSAEPDLWEDSLLIGTRSSQLSQILAWTESDSQSNIFLVVGGPGTGKTCIARNLWKKLKEGNRSSISLFVADDYAKRPECLWPDIALAVADIIPAFRVSLCHALDKWEKESEDRDAIDLKDIGTTFRKVIAEPIASIANEGRNTTVVVIDGLDRCYDRDNAGWKAIVESCVAWSQSLPRRFKFLVTTRPYDLIDTISPAPSVGAEQRLELHSGKQCSPAENDDIRRFLEYKLSKLAPEPQDNPEAATGPVVWPPRQAIARLVKDCEGLFSWASGIVNTVASTSVQNRDSQLASMVASGSSARYLDDFYKHILRSIFPSGFPTYFSTVVGTILVSKTPVTPALLEAFIPEGANQGLKAQELCRDLLPILSIDGEDHIELRHSSFASFVTDPRRCGPDMTAVTVNRASSNTNLALACFRTMETTLKFNISGTKTSYMSIKEVGSHSNAILSPELTYASQFWADHLKDAQRDPGDRKADGRSPATLPRDQQNTGTSGEQRGDEVVAAPPDKGQRNAATKADGPSRRGQQPLDTTLLQAVREFFLQNKWIYWLEVMSMLGCIDDASRQLAIAAGWIDSNGDKDLANSARDGSRFVSTFRDAMVFNPAHIYLSALPFFPLLHKQVSSEVPNHISVLNHDNDMPNRSPSGLRFSFLADKALQEPIIALALSADGKRVAALSNNLITVRIFSVSTGTPLTTLVEHETASLALAFFGKHLITGSTDGYIRIWDTDTGSQLGTPFQAHTDWIRDIAVSPDGTQLVSGCDDGTVRLINLNNTTPTSSMAPLRGHSDYVRSVTWTPNGDFIVSGSDDCTVRVWDRSTGLAVGDPMTGHRDYILAVAVDKSGKLIASGGYDENIRLWDLDTHAQLHSFSGCTGADIVFALAFSNDGERLFSGSYGSRIVIWETSSGKPIYGHSSATYSLRLVSESRILSGNHDGSIKLWDISPPCEEPTPSPLITFRPFFLANCLPDRETIVFTDGCQFCRWDTQTGSLVIVTRGIPTLSVWDVRGGSLLKGDMKGQHTEDVHSVAFSPDNNLVASCSADTSVCIWNVKSGSALHGRMEGHSGPVSYVVFSPDSQYLASIGGDTAIIWDVQSGRHSFRWSPGYPGVMRRVAWCPDSQSVAIVWSDSTIRVHDITSGKLVVAPLRGHRDPVIRVFSSPDGPRIVSSAEDRTVRVWDVGPKMQGRMDSEGDNELWLNADGWVYKGSSERKLFWVPPRLRKGLCFPPQIDVFGAPKIHLDLRNFVHGEDWLDCSSPSRPMIPTDMSWMYLDLSWLWFYFLRVFKVWCSGFGCNSLPTTSGFDLGIVSEPRSDVYVHWHVIIDSKSIDIRLEDK
ncbi:WD40-repeat-containing domain protein [Amylostereum chailletii]|nr:WD40-repeat-containing domain protein [Amylostereum chailletii]